MDTIPQTAMLLICFLSPIGASACELQINNASGLDLSIPVGSESSILVDPGESRHFPLQERLWIDFGIVAHEYDVSGLRATLCPANSSAPVQIKAQSDGSLWLDTSAPQPSGFPLRPIHVIDLTGSPSNNSFKPTPLRGAA